MFKILKELSMYFVAFIAGSCSRYPADQRAAAKI